MTFAPSYLVNAALVLCLFWRSTAVRSKKNLARQVAITLEVPGDSCSQARDHARKVTQLLLANLSLGDDDKFPLTAAVADNMSVSFYEGCGTFSAGDASRSDANFWETSDRKWVIKRIKPRELKALRLLAGIEKQDSWQCCHILPDASVSLDQTDHPHWSLWRALLTQGIRPGATYWVNKLCAHFLLHPWCVIVGTDPAYQYKHRLTMPTGSTLMVPIDMAVPDTQLVIMPNFISEFKSFSTAVLGSNPRFEKYDAKPLQLKTSEERGPFLARLARLGWKPNSDDTLVCNGPCGKQCWQHLWKALSDDVHFLSKGRPRPFIDYSLVFLVGTSDGPSTPPLPAAVPPSCVVSMRGGNSTATVFCVRLIDYLMEKGPLRSLEGALKGGKYDNYAAATQMLFTCAGDLTSEHCREFLTVACREVMRDKTRGVPPWCALVPETTVGAFDGARHCPNGDDAWECEEAGGPCPPTQRTCKDLVGKKCSLSEFSVFGHSDYLRRRASAAEACCCRGIGKEYWITHDMLTQELQSKFDELGF